MDINELNKALGNINANTFKLIDKIQIQIVTYQKHALIRDINKIQNIVSDLQGSSPISSPSYFTMEEVPDFEVKLTSLVNITASNVHGEINGEDWSTLKRATDELVPFSRVSKLINANSQLNETLETIKNELNVTLEKLKSNSDANISIILEKEASLNLSLNKTNNTIKDLTTSHKEIIKLSESMGNEYKSLNESNLEMDILLSKSTAAAKNIENIKNILTTAETSLQLIYDKSDLQYKEFNEKVITTSTDVKEILEKTSEIDAIKNTIDDYLTHSKDLINNSERAMSLTGTYRLSRSFKAAYLISVKSRDAWKYISAIFAFISLSFVGIMLWEMYGLDYSKLIESSTPAIMMFFARFTMLPIVLSFFVFSAMQYVKQNNICEDYAHKKLLSETLISFKDELTNSSDDKTTNYLKETLKEILRSPLTSSDKKSHHKEISHINGMITQTNKVQDKILDIIKPSTNKDQVNTKDNN